jgi:Zn-dependent peptidase ImmA (M78 family)
VVLTNADNRDLYDENMGVMAHRLTTDQLDFIVMHELGHVALDHSNRLKAASAPGRCCSYSS